MQKRDAWPAWDIRLCPHRAGAVDLNAGFAFVENVQLGDRDVTGVDAVVGEAFVDDLIEQGFEQRRMRAIREVPEKVADMVVVDVAEGREPAMLELGEQADIDGKLVGSLRMLFPRMD